MKRYWCVWLCGAALGCAAGGPPEPPERPLRERPAAIESPTNRLKHVVHVRDFAGNSGLPRDFAGHTGLPSDFAGLTRDFAGNRDLTVTKTDAGIAAEIRKRAAETNLSFDARRVKIVVRNGKVLLQGAVRSADEKDRLEEIALTAAGLYNVDCRLEVPNE